MTSYYNYFILLLLLNIYKSIISPYYIYLNVHCTRSDSYTLGNVRGKIVVIANQASEKPAKTLNISHIFNILIDPNGKYTDRAKTLIQPCNL